MFISGKGFNEECNLTFCRRYPNSFGTDISIIEEDQFIFLNLDLFWEFLNILVRNPPTNKFTLVTHNSDLTFTDGHYEFIEKYVNRVYAINNVCKRSNVITIPLGFRDYPWDTMDVLSKINLFEKEDKEILCYMNFKIDTNRDKRQQCWDTLIIREWVTARSDLSLEDFYCEMNRSKYVISPPGTGLDCHRVYESIYFNAIPILLMSQMDDFFKKLPVLIISDYNQLTKEMLEDRYTELYDNLIHWRNENPDWLQPSFWLKY